MTTDILSNIAKKKKKVVKTYSVMSRLSIVTSESYTFIKSFLQFSSRLKVVKSSLMT